MRGNVGEALRDIRTTTFDCSPLTPNPSPSGGEGNQKMLDGNLLCSEDEAVASCYIVDISIGGGSVVQSPQ